MSAKETEISLQVQKDFKDFCLLPNTLLSCYGQDFGYKPRLMWLDILKRIYFIMGLISHFYCITFITKFIIIMLMSDEEELSLLLRLLSGANYSYFATVKFLAFFWNLKGFKKIYETLETIYPKTDKEKIIHRVRIHFWPKWILSILYFYMGAVTFIAISPLMECIISFAVDAYKFGLTDAKFGYHKLYEVGYSFDHHHPVAYFVTYSMELMHAHFIVLYNIAGDILLLCFCLQLCMHFDYIARTLGKYEPNDQTAEKDHEFIAKILIKHQILLNISHQINKAFGGLLLLLLISTAGTLCCAAVYSITQGFGREFIEYIAFLPTVVGQYYLICYYGQQLVIKSQSVGDAVYNHNWYNGSKSYKTSIFLILMRSQKEVEINAFGFQPICLEAFKMVMGVTYRTFAVLKETML